MNRAAHHYQVFETAGGFCGIAWNGAGITRLQLPTKSAEATERLVLRRVPGAQPGTPPPATATAIAAVTRYFAGEALDFADLAPYLRERDPFFTPMYPAS